MSEENISQEFRLKSIDDHDHDNILLLKNLVS